MATGVSSPTNIDIDNLKPLLGPSLHMDESEVGKYTINIDNLKKWKQKMNVDRGDGLTECYKTFAKYFAQVIKYIPFNEMIAKIQTISDAMTALVSSGTYCDVYLIVPGQIKKSNTWIFLLFIEKLLNTTAFFQQNLEYHFMNSKDVRRFGWSINSQKYIELIQNINDKNLDQNKKTQKILCFTFDDMSYSGTQIIDYIHGIFEYKFYEGTDAEKKTLQDNIDFYLCMPYITKFAQEKITESFGIFIKYFKETEVLESFLTSATKIIKESTLSVQDKSKEKKCLEKLCISKHPDEPTYDHIIQSKQIPFQCEPGKIPVYFDHKVADSVSSFGKILLTGSHPVKAGEICEYIPLIGGIDSTFETLLNKPCSTKYLDFNKILDRTQTYTKFPKTFYKRPGFNYNYDEHILNPEEHLFDEIKRVKLLLMPGGNIKYKKQNKRHTRKNNTKKSNRKPCKKSRRITRRKSRRKTRRKSHRK